MNLIPPPNRLPAIRFAGEFTGHQDIAHHFHPCPELVLVVEGTCRFSTDAQSCEGRAGELFLFPPIVPHNQEQIGPVKTCYVGYDFGETNHDRVQRFDLGQGAATARWIEDICRLHVAGESRSVTDALLNAVLASVTQKDSRARQIESLHPDLMAALNYIDMHYLEMITVQDIVRHVHLSGSRLNELFRDQFGCGMIAYALELRLNLAERLLAGPYVSISDVSTLCGYNDCNYFIRAFRKRKGVSPDKWRRQVQSAKATFE